MHVGGVEPALGVLEQVSHGDAVSCEHRVAHPGGEARRDRPGGGVVHVLDGAVLNAPAHRSEDAEAREHGERGEQADLEK